MANRVPVDELNRLLRLGYRRADELEGRLVRLLHPILDAAGTEAARAFEQRATDFLTAAGSKADVTSTSCMVALYPTAEQAASLAEAGGEPPEAMHVTLAYLGKDVSENAAQRVADAMGRVAATHPPLAGTVGGLGSFADLGNGHPAIALPDVPGLIELRVAVCEAILGAGEDYARDHGFQAHLTIAYRDRGPQLPDSGLFGLPLDFSEIHVVHGGNTVARIPLTGTEQLTAGLLPVGDGLYVDEADLARVVAFVQNIKIEDAIADVAEQHAPEGGYGETWWHADDQKVFWNAADWTSGDEWDAAEAAFLAIDGVEAFDSDAEAGAPGGDGWTQVWPTGALTAATDPQWAAPAPDELIDVPALVSKLRTKTDPVRMAVVETMMTPVLEGAGLAFDTTNPLTAKVLAQSGSQITEIAQTTQLNVMRIIKASYDEGLTIPDTAKAIRAGMKEASAVRATLIARTELAGAVNGGSLAATQIVERASGVSYFKQWLTSPGAHFPRHEEYEGLDGQTVHLDDYFDVGGDQMQFPGDPNGSPEEVCNCRCTMTYTESADEVSDNGAGGGGSSDGGDDEELVNEDGDPVVAE